MLATDTDPCCSFGTCSTNPFRYALSNPAVRAHTANAAGLNSTLGIPPKYETCCFCTFVVHCCQVRLVHFASPCFSANSSGARLVVLQRGLSAWAMRILFRQAATFVAATYRSRFFLMGYVPSEHGVQPLNASPLRYAPWLLHTCSLTLLSRRSLRLLGRPASAPPHLLR